MHLNFQKVCNFLLQFRFQNDIYATTIYLEKFFENLLFGGKNELKNRYLHIDWKDDQK